MTHQLYLRRQCDRLAVRLRNGFHDRGAVLAEYGMLMFFVALAAFSVLVLFGGEVWELFRSTESEFDHSRKVPPPPD